MSIFARILCLVIICTNTYNLNPEQLKPTLATYLWKTQNIVQESENYLSFASDKRVTDIYLQYSPSISDETYASFNKSAHDKAIRVHLLGGAPNWINRDGKKEFDKMIDFLKTYQEEHELVHQFDGMHLDIEFYLLDLDADDEKQAIKNYISRVKKAKKYCENENIELSTSIPFWFEKLEVREKGYKNLSEWNIDNVDHTVIMAYRNSFSGSNGVVALIENELDYAREHNKNIIIALETHPSNEGDYLSFYDRPISELEDVLSALPFNALFGNDIHGFAIHHIDSWMNLYSK